MPEIREKRKEIIVVETIKGVIENVRFPNSSKWVFTDKDGKEYKVNPKSLDYFQDVKPGVAVELVYSEADYGKGFQEFLSSAKAVAPAIPEQTPDEQFNAMKREQEDKGNPIKPMTKDDWSEKDRLTRKSIERQTALKEANLRTPAEADASVVIATAKQFEAYLEGK